MQKIEIIVNEFVEKLEPISIHIDELIEVELLTSNEAVFEHSISVFNKVVTFFKTMDISSIQIELQIELLGDFMSICGVPKSATKLISLIDMTSMPVINVSVPVKNIWQPKLEMYFSPLPFQMMYLSNEINSLYEEYRTIEEMECNSGFTRWLTFSYVSDL